MYAFYAPIVILKLQTLETRIETPLESTVMNEVILEIKEVSNPDKHVGYDGYLIKTDKQEIFLGVSNGQCCCESWGVVLSEDTVDDYVGGYLIDIKVTDKALNSKVLNEVYYDEGGVMFVDLITTRGVLQFAVYNSHNGYYGHDAIVRSHDLNEDTYL